MLAQFMIYPTDDTHWSKDMAGIVEILEETGLEYRLGPMGTSVEGDWQQIMSAIHRCHTETLSHHGRVVTTITIDDRREHPHHLNEVVPAVENELGRLAKRTEALVKFTGRDF
jgi:uncharacterized protein (TIGR00106 family)